MPSTILYYTIAWPLLQLEEVKIGMADNIDKVASNLENIDGVRVKAEAMQEQVGA